MLSLAATDLKVFYFCEDRLEEVVDHIPAPELLNPSKITHLSYSHDNTYVAILHENRKPQIMSSKAKSHLTVAHTIDLDENVSCLCFKSLTKRIIALGTLIGHVLFYDTKLRDVVKEIIHLDSPILSLEFNSRDDQLVIGTDEDLHVLQSNGNEFQKLFSICQYSVSKYHRILPNILGTGDTCGTVIVRSTKNFDIVAKWHHHTSKVTSLAFTKYDNIAVTSGDDCRIVIFNYISSECIFKINLLSKVATVDISPDDRYFVTGQEDGSVHVFSFANLLSPTVVELAHTSPVTICRFENTCRTVFGKVLGDDSASAVSLMSLGNMPDAQAISEEIIKLIEEKLKSHNKFLQIKFLEECDKFRRYLFNEFYVLYESFAIWDIFCTKKTCVPSQINSRSYFTLK